MAKHRFSDSDKELVEYFTSAVGLAAQRYESSGSHAFDSNAMHEQMMRTAFQGEYMRSRRGPFTRFDAIGRTLARLDMPTRLTLGLVYAKTGAIVDGQEEVALDVGRLEIALRPKYGHGSFLRLAARQDRVIKAFEKQRDERVAKRGEVFLARKDPADPRYPIHARAPLSREQTVLDFLVRQAERGDDTKHWFRTVVQDCEAVRTPALGLYDAARIERVEREDEQRRVVSRERNASFDSELGLRVRPPRRPRPELQEVCDLVAEALGLPRAS